MTSDPNGSASLQASRTSWLPTWPSGLAAWAYRLACVGPCAFVVMGAAYSPTDYRALPALPVQILWWALALASPLGCVLGATTYFRIRHNPARQRDSSYAVAAMMVGALASIALVYGTRSLQDMRRVDKHRLLGCLSNMEQLNNAMQMYTQDYDDRYPLCKSWNEATMPYIKNAWVYRCPDEAGYDVGHAPSYAMNRQMQVVKASKVDDPPRFVLLFDSIPGANLAGGWELMPTPDRHNGYQSIGFADGHVKAVLTEDVGFLHWMLKTGAEFTPVKTQPASH